MNSPEFWQGVGFWAIPVLLVIWVIIKIAVKAEGKRRDDEIKTKKKGKK